MTIRLSLAVVALSLVFTGGVLAQVDQDPDGIGLYFDLAATNNCADFGVGSFVLHVLATNLSRPGGLTYYATKVVWDDPSLIYVGATYYPTGCIPEIVPAPGEIIPTCPGPMPWAPIIPLARLTFFRATPDPCRFDLVRYPDPSAPDCPAAYWPTDDPLHPVCFNPAVGDWNLPDAQIGESCLIVAAPGRTWGAIKGIYR